MAAAPAQAEPAPEPTPLLDVDAETRRRAQLDFLVREGVFTAAEQAAFLEAQPGFLRLQFGVAFEDERFVVMCKPFDVRLDLGRENARKFPEEVTAACWLRAKRGLEVLRFCHQLDAGTSGLLVVAKDKKAAATAATLFAQRRVRKQYLAVVFGHVAPGDHATIRAPLAPVEGSTFLQHVPPDGSGKPAETSVWVLRHGRLNLKGKYYGAPVSEVLLEPRTGRRHQLRVHLKSVGHPLVGDAAYAEDWDSYRLFLHAFRIALAPLPEPTRAIVAEADRGEFGDVLADAVDVEAAPPWDAGALATTGDV